MASFSPFAGIRYSPDLAPGEVTAPPYDVIDDAGRAELVEQSPYNAVVFDLPPDSDGDGRYTRAAEVFDGWRADGTLVTDATPTFTVYRMTFTDDHGRPARTLGVIGALELSRPDEGQILPHEHTTPKAKTDRLDLLRATGANLSPVWMLSLAAGLTELIEPSREPDQEWTDSDEVTHAVWVESDPSRLEAVSALVGSAPVVVADGHHRFETSLQYREERRAASGPGSDSGSSSENGRLCSDDFMCLVVELSADELTVRPIHRLVAGLTAADLVSGLLANGFEAVPSPADGRIGESAVADGSVLSLMDEAGAVAVVHPDGSATLLAPTAGAFDDVDDLDSARVARALSALDAGPSLDVAFQHGVDLVQRAVTTGSADAGILLRPATVAQIELNAHAGRRMPAKTTFFHPKPRTGVVFRDAR